MLALDIVFMRNMNNLFIALASLFLFVLFDRVVKIRKSYIEKRKDQLKINLLFLVLIIALGILLYFLIISM